MQIIWGCYALGLIGLAWFALDSSRIPSLVWFWSGFSRGAWWAAMVSCFVALGVPALLAAVFWRFGATRKGLMHEVSELRGTDRARTARLRGTAGGIA
jgi:hypothetical protein